MRLFVSRKEIPLVKEALLCYMDYPAITKEDYKKVSKLYDRVVMCEMLQESERRAKQDETEVETK